MSISQPTLAPKLWAQYHTVGPDGYADSDGEAVARPTVEAVETLVNRPDQLNDICWVDFSVFIDDKPYKVEESVIAVSQKGLRAVRFKPVSEVIENRRLTQHTAIWVGRLAFGDRSKNHDRPDRFEELLLLARSGAVEHDSHDS